MPLINKISEPIIDMGIKKINKNTNSELELLLAINKNNHLKPFLDKPYGLNLLFLLETLEKDKADNGIEETFDRLLITKPKKLAFVQYSNQLAKNDVITLKSSPIKKSKKNMRLSKKSKNALAGIRRKFNIKIV